MATSEAIVVGMRLRPMLPHEKGEKHCLKIEANMISVVGEDCKGDKSEFVFDIAMDSSEPSSHKFCDQQQCYELMGMPIFNHMLSGFNTCLFCYGQTGTGKTTTIMGDPEPVEKQGLLLRLLNDVCNHAAEKTQLGCKLCLRVQMLEVYNEKVNDLICPKGKNDNRKVDVHVHPKHGVYLKGATETAVANIGDCVSLLEFGNSNKTVAATAMNPQSSRGHTVFKLVMDMAGNDGMDQRSEIYFVDLAGRENEKTTLVTGDRKVELTFINKSLMFLAQCITNIGKSQRTGDHEHKRVDMSLFRNSKLTLMLSSALAGNSRTTMIGTLSPAARNFNETYTTLKFAATVKTIKIEAKATTKENKGAVIKNLEDEIKELKEQLSQAQHELAQNASGMPVSGEDMEHMESQLIAAEGLIQDRQQDPAKVMASSAQQAKLRGEGILSSTISLILGEERASNPEHVAEVQQYYHTLMAKSDDKQLQEFARSVQFARGMIEQANAITADVKRGSGLYFELDCQTPILALSFGDRSLGHIPEVGVRLMRRRSAGWARWMWAYEQLRLQGKIGGGLIHGALFAFRRIATKGLMSAAETRSGWNELVAAWSWQKFEARLDFMQHVHARWSKDPNCRISHLRDPWTPWGYGVKPLSEALESDCGKYVKQIMQLTKELKEAREQLAHQRQGEIVSAQKPLCLNGLSRPSPKFGQRQLPPTEDVSQMGLAELRQALVESRAREMELVESNEVLIKQLMKLRENTVQQTVQTLKSDLPLDRLFASCIEQSDANLKLLATLNTRLAESESSRRNIIQNGR